MSRCRKGKFECEDALTEDDVHSDDRRRTDNEILLRVGFLTHAPFHPRHNHLAFLHQHYFSQRKLKTGNSVCKWVIETNNYPDHPLICN